MPKGNRARAAKRNAERRAKNAVRRVQQHNTEVKLRYARHKTQLELLFIRGCLGKGEDHRLAQRRYDAGDRLYKDWRSSGSEPRLVGTYEQDIIRCVNGGHTQRQVEARLSFETALKAVVSEAGRRVLVHVVLADQRIKDWSEGSSALALSLLRDALDDLIRWRLEGKSERRVDRLESNLVQMC